MAPAVLCSLGWAWKEALNELGYQGYWSGQGGAPWSDSPRQLGVLELDP